MIGKINKEDLIKYFFSSSLLLNLAKRVDKTDPRLDDKTITKDERREAIEYCPTIPAVVKFASIVTSSLPEIEDITLFTPSQPENLAKST